MAHRLDTPLALILFGLLSFGVNLHSLADDPVGGFFLPQARFWELLIGGVGVYVVVAGHPRTSAEGGATGRLWLGQMLAAHALRNGA